MRPGPKSAIWLARQQKDDQLFCPRQATGARLKTKGRWGNIREDNVELGPWRERVALAAYEAIGLNAQGEPITARGVEGRSYQGLVFGSGVPIALGLDFVLYRPKNLSKNRPTPPATKKPDGDKLERAICDALTHVLWADDNQVTIVLKRKRVAEIGESPGVHIWVVEATENTS